MSGAFLLFSDLVTSWVRIFAGLLLVCAFLQTRRPGKKGAAVVLAFAALFALLPLERAEVFWRIAPESALIAVCGRKLLGAGLRMSLFVGIFYELAVFFWQFLLSAGMGVLFGSEEFLVWDACYGQCAVWLLHALLAVFAVSLAKLWEMTEQAARRAASAAALAGLLAVVTLSEQKTIDISEDTLGVWTILSVVLLMSVVVFHISRQYEVEKELARLKAEQAELLERDYTALSRTYEVQARLFHDLHNHIEVLRRLLADGSCEEAVGYLNELQAPVREIAATVWTGDSTADCLINSKAASAAALGVRFQAQVEFPRRANIKSADLCAILGNLLDNAVEAAGRVQEADRRSVTLTIRRIHQMLVIKVENTFSVAPVSDGKGLRTTKTDGGLHGWGLKSAQIAAEKYDGTVRTSVAGELFCAVATLFYQGIE